MLSPDTTSLFNLVLLLLCSIAATQVARIAPLYFFSGELPEWLRNWLNFVPAAVLAALVAPDLLFYGGSFDPDPTSNLFLLAGLASILFAVVVKNFFATIVFAMAFVALMRHLDFLA